jgi:hypothetical protein
VCSRLRLVSLVVGILRISGREGDGSVEWDGMGEGGWNGVEMKGWRLLLRQF